MVALILISFKLIAYTKTGSVALLSSLLDSIVDIFASIITYISVKRAMRPETVDYRYGHGKVESLAALMQAAFIMSSAIFLYVQSLQSMNDPKPITHSEWGILVMAISIFLTVILVVVQSRAIKQTGSAAITADSAHYKGDLIMNMGVIGSLLLGNELGLLYVDGLFGLVVAFYLSKAAFSIGKSAYAVLLDAEISAEDRAHIIKIIKSHPKLDGLHDIRTRTDGQRIFIECHIEVDGNLSLKDAHLITEEIELMIYKNFPNADIIIHQEPAGLHHDKHHKRDDIIINAT
jgi:ferrous-iron efflux pump FieF